MIREASADDLPRLLQMGERFFNAAGWPEFAAWDVASIEQTLRFLIDNETGGLFVAEVDGEVVGMAGAMVTPFYFNLSHLTGQELFWWVEPEHRGVGGGLLDAMEAWAKRVGAQTFTMIAVDRIRPELMARVYRGRGYRPAEHSFMRRL